MKGNTVLHKALEKLPPYDPRQFNEPKEESKNMKKKEYDVWVIVDNNENPGRLLDWTNTSNKPSPWIKARLIIELPERKVQITESQFDEMWDEFNNHLPSSEALAIKYHLSKQKLFGEKA